MSELPPLVKDDWSPPSPKPVFNIELPADRILKMLALTDRVAKLSDAALSTAVIEKVWGPLNLGGEQDALLDEMIRRFDEAKGISPYPDLTQDEYDQIEQADRN
jgi:hypothetical protein